ncbi:non-homologous end-joining factor 1 [Pseudoliparis swirei]|uniref:non-homologous end-joining factor 1 n=1 Tax=Pseudoliparis swirei TaxID=2059687 RepID=UPI0024BE854A|nr:non-homologous end-joining factor 1 [Pseudoliparis swirei]XP_056287180.1 non-homologous end-joining factor 1 [Pseudoliparis swirei]
MEARGADALLQRPWLPVSIGGCRLLAKSCFGEAAYRLLLTDGSCVWEERMDSAAIQRRAQELNRRLRAKVEAFFSHLCEVAQPCLTGSDGQADGETQISLTRQEDGNIAIKLKSELVGLPFYWEFHCTPAPVTVACAQLVRPLLAMSHLLQWQVEQLGSLLGRKDAEIQDYRENGAVLSRERLQTDVFVEKTYREDFMTKALPLLPADRSGPLGLDADLRRLYAVVVAHDNARKRSSDQRPAEEEEEADAAASSGGADPGAGGPGDAAAAAKMANRPAEQQVGPTEEKPRPVSRTAERASSKPKKKKVGLFR